MRYQRVWAAYFSATGTTKKTVTAIASELAARWGAEERTLDFTLPGVRAEAARFSSSDLVIFGTPVYAGRVPNVLLGFLSSIEGGGAAAVPVTLFGNRDYDDALLELKDILEADGFHIVGAAAFVGEHSFSDVLAGGRPDGEDLARMSRFAAGVAEKLEPLSSLEELPPLAVPGVPKPYRGYYQPRDRKGNPVDIRKVKPLTGSGCDDCGICAALCPMGSIDVGNVREFTGICIKCGSCSKRCPQKARYFEDPGYLYHKRELEEGLTRRAEPALFL